jgi:Zn-dependent protease
VINRQESPVLELVLSLCLLVVTGLILRGGWSAPRGLKLASLDRTGLLLGVLAIAAAWFFWGLIFGIALVVAVVIHEFGHVAAFRVCGHADARFRLIPLMGGVAISNSIPASADKSLFISLMGPAICLAPMALCYALAQLLYVSATTELWFLVANFLHVLALVLGALNFFNLLPLWPLDGGKITQRLVHHFAPGFTRQTSIAMAVLAAALCLATRSYFLLFFVMMSWQGLVQSETLLGIQRRMPNRTAWIALAAYVTTTAAFFLGGQALLAGFF